MITQLTLKKHLHYDENTGLFVRIKSVRKDLVSKNSGSINSDGYSLIYVAHRRYKAQHLAWVYIHGRLPVGQIDHIKHNRSDNRLCNLREVSKGENLKNKSRYASNTSGITGVIWHSGRNRWIAAINSDNKRFNLGAFTNKADAVIARQMAEYDLGFHANHGI